MKNIGQHEEVTNNKNGAEMLESLKSNESNEVNTLNNRVKEAGPEWTRQCIQGRKACSRLHSDRKWKW